MHGIDDINELENMLHEHVAKLFHGDIPPITCRKFFPEPKDIRNHVYRIKAQMNPTNDSHLSGNSSSNCTKGPAAKKKPITHIQQASSTISTIDTHHQQMSDKRETIRALCDEIESLLDTCDPKILDDLEERLRQIRDSMVPACITEQDVVSSVEKD